MLQLQSLPTRRPQCTEDHETRLLSWGPPKLRTTLAQVLPGGARVSHLLSRVLPIAHYGLDKGEGRHSGGIRT
jgi:hypothetical protein